MVRPVGLGDGPCVRPVDKDSDVRTTHTYTPLGVCPLVLVLPSAMCGPGSPGPGPDCPDLLVVADGPVSVLPLAFAAFARGGDRVVLVAEHFAHHDVPAAFFRRNHVRHASGGREAVLVVAVMGGERGGVVHVVNIHRICGLVK